MQKGVMVVELSKGHYELLYSKWKVLNPEFRTFFATQDPDKVREHGVPGELCLRMSGGVFRWLMQIHSICRRKNISTVWINTAEGSKALRLTILLKALGYRVFGTVHNAQKLKESRSQKWLSRFLNGNFVLTRQIHSYWSAQLPKLPLRYFYACYWPAVRGTLARNEDNFLTIAVVGQIEQKRRDVESLLQLATQLKKNGEQKIRFVMVANPFREEAKAFHARVYEKGLGDYFQLFEHRPTQDELLAIVQSCDGVALLAHPDVDYADLYRHSKISGAYNLAIGWRRPLIVHEFMRDQEYDPYAIYYNLENWDQQMVQFRNSRDRGKQLAEAYDRDERFSIEMQKERVHSFLD